MFPTIRFDVAVEYEPLGVGLDPSAETAMLLERAVACGGPPEHVVWVFGADGDDVERTLRRAEPVGEVTVLPTNEGAPDGRCYQIRWDGPPDGIFAPLRSAEGTLLEAVCSEERWRFTARIPTEGMGRFREGCRRRELRTEIRTVDRGPVRRYGDEADTVWNRLTRAQSEALTLALELGYFEVPRRTSLEDLASELGVSDSATSQRLRRGLSTLLRATIELGPASGRRSKRLESSDYGTASTTDE
jgi:predicted DNA binding protein